MEPRDNWKAVRQGLLDLHKVLLDRERVIYEIEHEPIESPGAFLQIALSNERFEWLRQLSGLVIRFDEILSVRKPGTPEQGAALLAETRRLLMGDGPEGFRQKYEAALADTPGAVRLNRELLAQV